MRVPDRKLLSLAALATAALAACGDDDKPAPTDAGADTADSGTDVGVDSGADGGTDGGTDAGVDTTPDASANATCDAPNPITGDGPWQVSGDTRGAPSPLFGACSEEPAGEQVWTWTAPQAGLVEVVADGQDTVLYVRSSCDDDTTEVACNDDADAETFGSRVRFETEAGATWFLIVDAYDEEEESAYTLSVSLDPDGGLLPIEDGDYVSRGYGMALSVEGGQFALIDETDISCLVTGEGSIADLESDISDITFDDDGFTVLLSGGLAPLRFDKVDAYTRGCADGPDPVVGDDAYTRDALVVFDVVAQTFSEHYAFFELREIDWSTLTADARATLTSDSDDEALYDALVSVLEPLEDGHVSLQSTVGEFESKPLLAISMLYDEFEDVGGDGSPDTYVEEQLGRWYEILDGACDEGLSGVPGDMTWCMMGDVGYINTLHFGFETLADASAAIDAALDDVGDADAIVFDIRINGGGSDTHSLEIASRFATARTMAFSKRAVDGDGFTDATDVYTEAAAEGAYEGDVVLLVSGSTVSAAEIFTLAMRELPTVTVAGHNTSGELSDILARVLPNGWTFGLSNEIYTAADGEVYEMVGIPPDELLELPLIPRDERVNGTDAWLDAARALAIGGE